jgi:hypothetical protein
MPKPRFEGVSLQAVLYTALDWYRVLDAYGLNLGLSGIMDAPAALITPLESVSVKLN